MTPPTPEELLRLARKAWPGKRPYILNGPSGAFVQHEEGTLLAAVADQERFHAALLVLAGEVEVDVEALQKRIEDSDDTLRIALAVATCAGAWEPEARLIGNVRAVELLTLAQAFVGLHEQNAALLAERDAYLEQWKRAEADLGAQCRRSEAIRAELAEAELRGRRKALAAASKHVLEQQRLDSLDGKRPKEWVSGYLTGIGVAACEIVELDTRGDHVRSPGTPPPGAGDSSDG